MEEENRKRQKFKINNTEIGTIFLEFHKSQERLEITISPTGGIAGQFSGKLLAEIHLLFILKEIKYKNNFGFLFSNFYS